MYNESLVMMVTKATDNLSGSPLDWEKHRERIIQLYANQNLTISEVRALMIENYNFKATVRQYTRKLKSWGVLKNLKAKEKDALLAKIAEARAQHLTVIKVKLNGQQVDIARLRRHFCSKLKQSTRPSQRRRSMRVETPELEAPQYHIEIICEESVLDSEEDIKYEGPLTPESSCKSSWEQMTITENLPSADLATRNGREANNPRLGSKRFIGSLPRQLNSTGSIATLENILHFTQILIAVSSQGGHPPTSISSLGFPTNNFPTHSLEMMKFWTDVKNSIYFLKLGPKEAFSARALASKACHQLMSSSVFSLDVTILKELFSTLSHANTGIYPKIRTFLLRNLIVIFKLRLGPNHPLPRLCWYLHNDALETNSSDLALRLTLDSLEKHLGQDHISVLDTRRSLIRQLRRSGNLHSAEVLCKVQISSTKRLHEPTSSAVRKTMSELVHIYKDKGDYLLAKELCQNIINSGIGFPFLDETAIYAMEDLAELREILGDRKGCFEVLSVAHDGAFGLWGGEASPTVCISTKIQALGA